MSLMVAELTRYLPCTVSVRVSVRAPLRIISGSSTFELKPTTRFQERKFSMSVGTATLSRCSLIYRQYLRAFSTFTLASEP